MEYKSDNLVDGAIDIKMIELQLGSACVRTDAGAFNLFLGQVRNDIVNGKEVRGIIYSAYGIMFDKELNLIINHILDKYSDVKNVNVLHSTGMVNVGENSLLVYLSSGHRKQAFEALQETVELIKKRLPVWKKEVFDDGSYRWPSNNH